MCSFPDTFGLLLNIEERGIRSAFKSKKQGKNKAASAGNRTRVNCLEGSYAHHYTTDALINYLTIQF